MSLPTMLWRLATCLVAPLLPLHLARRVGRGKEIADRLPERRGLAVARPPGRLLWLHAASVGEAVSALPVLEALAALEPALHLLVTTGTVTGAEALAQRLPPALTEPGPDGFARLTHRFLPLDVPAWVGRFLDGWRPDAGALVESELWPNLLAAARRRGMPMALVNARISPRSFARWRRLPVTSRQILGGFRLVLARSEADRARLLALGAAGAQCWGDLKASAAPLPAEPEALEQLRAVLGDRPVFLAASTHPGEEALLLAAQPHMAAVLPGLLMVLVPRHPERGVAVETLALRQGVTVARRSAGEAPGPEVAVYVADTLGELGLFYRLAGAALIGGSLVPRGGQNPLEAARLGCPILLGPYTGNFEEPVARLLAAGGAVRVAAGSAGRVAAGSAVPVAVGADSPAEVSAERMLADQLVAVLSDHGRTRAMVAEAALVAEGQAGLPGQVARALLGLMPGG